MLYSQKKQIEICLGVDGGVNYVQKNKAFFDFLCSSVHDVQHAGNRTGRLRSGCIRSKR